MRTDKLNDQVQAAWDHVFNHMYHEETGIVFDYRTSTDPDGAFSHLPTPKEIQAQVPNPCGWDTGMENGVIFVGLLLDAIANRYKVTKDETLHDYAVKILKGLRLLTSVSGVRGFLARAVHPDGKSFYFESSRDQYTFAVYGMWSYLNCPLCTNDEREFLTDTLVAFAEYAEKCVTPENDYHLLRADGGRTMVCKMLYSAPHEWTRLPMIYLVAYKASGNSHWLEKYKEIRALCIDGSFEMKEKCGAMDQMQASLAVLYELEDESYYRSQYETLARRCAEWVECEKANSLSFLEKSKKEKRTFDDVTPLWRKQEMTYLHFWGAPISGYGYYKPFFKTRSGKTAPKLTTISQYALIEELCPNRHVSEEHARALEGLFALINFDKHCSESPIHMLQAYWLIQANRP